MYETSSFCERCGLDRDSLGSAGAREFNVCPDCSSSCCSNCWNQVAGACLACRPFELAGATTAGAWALRPPTIDLEATQKPSRPVERPGSATRSPRPVPTPVAPAVAAVADSSASARTYARRGMAKAARLALVIAVVLAVVVGVRAVNFNGGAVAAQDSVAPTPDRHDRGVGHHRLLPADRHRPSWSDRPVAARQPTGQRRHQPGPGRRRNRWWWAVAAAGPEDPAAAAALPRAPRPRPSPREPPARPPIRRQPIRRPGSDRHADCRASDAGTAYAGAPNARTTDTGTADAGTAHAGPNADSLSGVPRYGAPAAHDRSVAVPTRA